MGCKLAENEPLKRMRLDMRLPLQCHSLREDCVHKLQQPVGDFTMGIPGAVIGYCQALFNKNGSSLENTRFITKELESIQAPWSKSHELFWGNKGVDESIEDFLSSSMQPLLGSGRIPILITPLDPKIDFEVIREIFHSQPRVFKGETILVRLVLSSRQSIDNVKDLLKGIIDRCWEAKEMPKFWPLLQGNLPKEEWHYLKLSLGDLWAYSNIAVNPFTLDSLPDFCLEQVTVAQVVLGHAEGVSESGIIQLAKGMKISGAQEEDTYDIFNYFKKLAILDTVPTQIILGPSLPDWDNKYNLKRIERLLPVLKKACDVLWDGVSTSTRETVWELTA